MADWLSSMQQTYEYYIVDPNSWKDVKKLTTVKNCTITRDEGAETLGSAFIDVTDSLGESYIRVYLITVQNGITERHPLGTVLVQTPSSTFNGKTRDVSMDAYTPLLELKENPPPLGYSILKGANIMDMAYRICREQARAPVVGTECSTELYDDFVSNVSDTWLTFLADLLANAKYKFGLDEMGRILFLPEQDTASLQPVWTYNDDNSSIIYSNMTLDHDLYGIPNVVEVAYSSGSNHFYAKVVNDDPNSPTSTISRGREITHRVTDPNLAGTPSQYEVQEYAERLLREMSTLEYMVAYSHAYCPVRIGDCVRINYSRAGLNNVKAKVIHQTIKCELGCQVDEKAVFTIKLWG